MAKNKQTKLNSFSIKKFRGLKELDIEFGDRVTLICGRNGTSKSTILGVAGQIFSFDKDVSCDPAVDLKFQTLNDKPFKSTFSEHFRFSQKFDTKGGMNIAISVYDGYFEREINNLKLAIYSYTDRKQVRPIVRNNVPPKGGKNTSRNVTHPVIYLSLSRLIPVSQRINYSERSVKYLEENKKEFQRLCRDILGKQDLTHITATEGDVSSAVAHSEHYDQDSVSVGEDNVGQLVLALLSFKKLKEEYSEYKGGLLLIDEADAGLFPAAQKYFLREISKISKELSLQIVMTSHSPTLIEEVKKYSDRDPRNFKTIYLTSTYGPIEVKENWGWSEIYADLNIETYSSNDIEKLPRVNTYFEDGEAFDFFNAIVRKQKIRKPLSLIKDVKLGCGNYLNLMKEGVREFTHKSVIVFDADVSQGDGRHNCVYLPGTLPPDQLLFEFLFKLPREDAFWKNDIGFTRDVFVNSSRKIYSRLGLSEEMATPDFSLNEIVRSDDKSQHGNAIREDFKNFYKDEEIQKIIHGRLATNPFNVWAKKNPELVDAFNQSLEKSIKSVLSNGYGVDTAKLSGITCK